MEIQRDISLEKNEFFVGKKLKVLIESVEGDFFVGRSYRDAPEVDGEVLINKNNNNVKIGHFYNVEINDYDEYDLFGDILLKERKKK